MEGKKSQCWDYFEMPKIIDGKTVAQCKNCSDKISCEGSSTSGLLKHLFHKHLLIYEKLKKITTDKVPMIQQRIDTFIPKLSDGKIKCINKAIAHFIAIDMQPVRIVESAGFISLMNELEPRHTIPSRSTFSRNILPELYEETKVKIIKNITNTRNIIFTFDFWTSVSVKSFLAITLHFINEQWILTNYLLKVEEMKEEHTGEQISKFIQAIFYEFGISSDNRFFIFGVSDSAKNLEKAMQKMGFFNLKCFAHILNNVIKKSLSELNIDNENEILWKVREITKRIKASVKKYNALREIAKKLRAIIKT